MKPITISPVSLVLGVLLAAGLFLVMGQAGPTSYGTWGPPKKSIVNIFEYQQPSIPLAAGGYLSVYQVPPDRWLTLTAVSLFNSSYGTAPSTQLRWCELGAGVFMNKGFAADAFFSGSGSSAFDANPALTPAAGGGVVGWVFRPGSQVVIRNESTTNASNFSGYALIGYETRD